MSAALPFSLDELLPRFDGPSVRAVVLMGSYARGDPGPYSDVDLVRFLDGSNNRAQGAGSYLIRGHLVVVSDVAPAEVEAWFTRPEEAVKVIAGLCLAHPLLDRDGSFLALQRRAHEFTWDAAMQERADRWASEQMVGWAEEAHKGLEGLRRGDIGRLLNGRHGLSWGLTRIVQVQRGVLESGDNAFYDALAQELGPASEWVRLRALAFGIGAGDGPAPSLPDQVRAGLRLYAATAELLEAILLTEHRPLVADTVQLIHAALAE